MPVIPCQCVSSWNQGLLGGDYFWSQWEQLYWLVISVDSFMHFQLAPGSFMDRDYFWSQWEQLYGLSSVWILSCISSWHQGLSWIEIIFGHNESSYMVCQQCGFFHSFPAGTRVFHRYNLFLVTMRAAIWFDISVDSFMYFQLAPGSFLDGYYFSSQWEPLHSFISVDSFMNFQLAPGLSWMQIIFGHNESSYVVCHQCGFFHAFSAGTRAFVKHG